MYSGWSPFFKTKFWKKEFVGKGVDKRLCAKNWDGSGRTVDFAFGNRKGCNNGLICCFCCVDISGDFGGLIWGGGGSGWGGGNI